MAAERTLLASLLLIQAGLFAASVLLHWDRWLGGDNDFYAMPAWNLVSGHGLSYARDTWEDPFLTTLYHATHPSTRASGYVPAVTLPPGYSLALAGVYAGWGRSDLAAVLFNGLLLASTLLLMAILVRRAFGRTLEARIALGLVAILPDWAHWAAHVMSDTLHGFLLTAFATLWLSDRPSDRRSLLAGLMLGLASLVRPYAALLPVAFGLARMFVPAALPGSRQVVVLALATWSVIGTWTARNTYHFGTPIVVTSMQLGFSLWMGTYEMGATDAEVAQAYAGLGDLHRVAENERLEAIAITRIRERPALYALACALRVPKLWTVLAWGPATAPVELLQHRGSGAAAVLLTKLAFAGLYLALLLTMLAGLAVVWRPRNAVLAGGIVIVVYFTAAFAPLHTESRYVLPARFFGLLLSASSIGYCMRRWGPPPPDSPGPGSS